MTVTVSGIGSDTFTDSMDMFSNQSEPDGGAYDDTKSFNLLFNFNSSFATYAMSTLIGRFVCRHRRQHSDRRRILRVHIRRRHRIISGNERFFYPRTRSFRSARNRFGDSRYGSTIAPTLIIAPGTVRQ